MRNHENRRWLALFIRRAFASVRVNGVLACVYFGQFILCMPLWTNFERAHSLCSLIGSHLSSNRSLVVAYLPRTKLAAGF